MAAKPSTRFVRKAQRKLIEPAIEALGFAGKYPEWRRAHGAEWHYLYFSTRKYGGGFSFSAARARKGKYRGPDGKVVDTADWTIANTDFDDRAHAMRCAALGRVADRTMAWQSLGDFGYEHIAGDAEACRALVAEAAAVLPQIDAWLKDRTPGPNLSYRGHRPRDGLSAQFRWHKATGMVGQFSLDAERPATPFMDAQREADTVDYPVAD